LHYKKHCYSLLNYPKGELTTMNKTARNLVVLGITILAAALLLVAQRPHSSGRHAVNLPGATADMPFSRGIMVGNMLFVAGHSGHDANGKLRPGGIGPETQAALENIKQVVEAAGMQMSDVVSTTVYIADINDWGEMTRVYKTFFPEPRPARTTVQVTLGGNARVEINAIAVKAH
jgi:2-iminobutanoate/2-iminopropanoate deaminase